MPTQSVGKNDILAAGVKRPKMTKLTYAEVAKISNAVEAQNEKIRSDSSLKESCGTPPH